MQITTVSYGYTFNRGNFQSERIDLTAALGEGDDPETVALLPKSRVLRLGGDERGARDVEGDAECRLAELAELAQHARQGA